MVVEVGAVIVGRRTSGTMRRLSRSRHSRRISINRWRSDSNRSSSW